MAKRASQLEEPVVTTEEAESTPPVADESEAVVDATADVVSEETESVPAEPIEPEPDPRAPLDDPLMPGSVSLNAAGTHAAFVQRDSSGMPWLWQLDLEAGEYAPIPLTTISDSFTLVDVSQRPFRAVQHVAVPSIPEGVALSPDGRWVAALCMAGCQLPPGAPGHQPNGRLQLFEVSDAGVRQVADLSAGAAAQGVVFTDDGRHVVAQFYADECLALFEVAQGTLLDTGIRVPVKGGPAGLSAAPR